MSQLTQSEKQNLRKVVEAIFGTSNTIHWKMNEELLLVVGNMLQANIACSNAMDHVPRPGVYLNLKDVLKEIEKIANRINTGNNSYEICSISVKNKWRTAAEIAAQGL